MNNVIYFISFIFLLFIIMTITANISNFQLSTKKRNLSEGESLIKREVKTQSIQEQAQNQDEINYEVYMEIKNLRSRRKKEMIRKKQRTYKTQ